MNLNTSVKELFLIGPAYAKRLEKLGIKTTGGLLYHFPFRYLDYSLVSPINRLRAGEIVTIKGRLTSIKNEYTRGGKKIQKGIVSDTTGIIEVIWFNQPFLIKTLKIGSLICLAGKVDFWGRKITLVSPEYEILKSEGQIHTGGLIPVYHETYGISSKWLRTRIANLIKNPVLTIEEFLPSEIIREHDLEDLKTALIQIHFPKTKESADKTRKRFAFEELFLIQLATLLRKKKWEKQKPAQKLYLDQEKILEFVQNLPFTLTSAQKKVLREIFADLEKNKAMNRLVEGDVGSGKTVVAAAAIFVAYFNKIQSAFMAPTEILAHQHFETLNRLLSPLGVKISLLTGGQKKTEENWDLIIGTHALIYKRAKFKNLGLVIIDEQHRFGVGQRAELIGKGKLPHVLTMTATPIPRTVALTLYGDLDLSALDEMPPGRQNVKTWVVPPQKRPAAYQWIKQQIKKTGSQIFIICPLIEESDQETLQSVKAVKSEFEKLKKEIFPELRLALLHGRLKSGEKTEILKNFRAGKFDILVSTPVVEVGIDIPTATVIVIEGAQRFGLAQLHQLRGRVGRGAQQSYCLIFSDDQNLKTLKRLKAMERINVGMKLAELDLEMRGPGELYGTKQHGFLDLKVASFADLALIEKTKKAAEEILTKIDRYPLLRQHLKEDIIKTNDPLT